jgi:hypothetical protein
MSQLMIDIDRCLKIDLVTIFLVSPEGLQLEDNL